MAEILANVTQIINNSPQVNSLVGGHMAAAEEAKRIAQMAESERQRVELQNTVLAMENSSQIGASDPDGQQRRESRRELRRRQTRSKRARRDAPEVKRENDGCAASPFETKPIIDVCV